MKRRHGGMIGTTRFGIIVGSSHVDEDGGVVFVELESSVCCLCSSYFVEMVMLEGETC